jgi:hypothetical protein
MRQTMAATTLVSPAARRCSAAAARAPRTPPRTTSPPPSPLPLRPPLASQDQGPPEHVVEAGDFSHPCEGEAVCKLTNEKVCPNGGSGGGEGGSAMAHPGLAPAQPAKLCAGASGV